MDKNGKTKIVLEVRRRLLEMRKRTCAVNADFTEFDRVCDDLEYLAKLLLSTTEAGFRQCDVSIRRKIYSTHGYLDKGIKLDKDGVPYKVNGKKLLKVNLEPWTAKDALMDKRIANSRKKGHTIW